MEHGSEGNNSRSRDISEEIISMMQEREDHDRDYGCIYGDGEKWMDRGIIWEVKLIGGDD